MRGCCVWGGEIGRQNAGKRPPDGFPPADNVGLEKTNGGIELAGLDRRLLYRTRLLAQDLTEAPHQTREPGQSRRIRNARTAEENDTPILVRL